MADPLSLSIAGGGLLVSIVALWRSGRVRVLDRRTELRRDLADLGPMLDALERSIPAGVQSRLRVDSALGAGGASEIFKKAAEHDLAATRKLRDELDEIGQLPRLAGYDCLETKLVSARTVRTKVEQLTHKYAAAWAEDEAKRQHLREHMTAVTAAKMGRQPPPGAR